MSEVKRYDMVSHNRGMETWDELEQRPDGDYVSYEDYAAMTAERDRLAADLATATARADAFFAEISRANGLMAAALERATVAERELEQIAEDAAGEDL